MVVNVNKKITDKIRDGNFHKDVKEFLKDILIFELEHFEEAKPQYMGRYEEFVCKYTGSK